MRLPPAQQPLNISSYMKGREMKPLISRHSDHYENALLDRTYNARRPSRRPAGILLAQTEQDVVQGVRLARRNGWKVSIRTSGHSFASWPLQDDALLIDVKGLRELSYDDESQLAQAGPGVLGGTELRPFLARFGRFVPTGHHHTVGLGGYLLCGGHAWNTRGFGWTAEYVVGVDVVTADGKLLHANESQNSDLYWAARGAGPAFPGIVVRYHLRTRCLPGHIAHSTQMYPMELYDQVMPWLIRDHRNLGLSVEVLAFRFLGHHLVPGHTGNLLVVTALSFADTAEQAAADLAPLESSPALDEAFVHIIADPTSIERYTTEIIEDPEPAEYGAVRIAADNAWINATPEETASLLRPAFFDLVSPQALVFWTGFAPLRRLPDMAFDLHGENYFVIALMWGNETEDERLLQWRDQRMRELDHVTIGQFVAEVDQNKSNLHYMSEANRERLSKIIHYYDPHDVFSRPLSEHCP